jgi:hypothetical protein
VRLDPVPLEQPPHQLELRAQELLLGPLVRDRDAPRARARAAHRLVLGDELRDDPLLHPLDREQVRAQTGEPHGIAEGRGMEPVHERAPRVGVDLDQARAGGRDVEVVAHEGAEVARREAQVLGRAGVHARLPARAVREPEGRLHRALQHVVVRGVERDHGAARERQRSLERHGRGE